MDVSTTKIHLDTFISWMSNSERREYELEAEQVWKLVIILLEEDFTWQSKVAVV